MADDYASAVDEYLTRAYDGDRRRGVLARSGWDPTFATELADLGWFALAVPESRDGLGEPLSALGPVFAQYGRHLVAGPLLESTLLPALLEADPLTRGVGTGAPPALVDPGITEHWTDDVGSVTLAGGRLRGVVHTVRFAPQAEVLVVVAETGHGPSIHVVDPRAPGVVVEDLVSADPTTTFGRVVLDDVGAGESAGDHVLVTRLRSWARLLLACELGGLAQRCVERTLVHVREREQFGRPVGSFQAVKHIAATMHVRAAGLADLCTAALADTDGASVEELAVTAATAKAHAALVAPLVCEDALQLQGGMGFTAENELSAYYRHALALRGWYGDPTELELRVGAAVLGPRPERQP